MKCPWSALRSRKGGWLAGGPAVFVRGDDVRWRVDADEALTQGVADQVGAIAGMELAHDVSLVGLDGLHADEELLADALVRVTFGDELEHFALAAGEQVVAGLRFGLLCLPEVVLNGVAFAVLTGVIAYAWFKVPGLGVVIGLAMICNMIAAAAAGILIPLAIERFRFDPAVASGVFVTTVTDVVGFFSFLGIATLWFGLK